MLRSFLKKLAFTLAPDLALTYSAIRGRRLVDAQCKDLGLIEVAKETAAVLGGLEVASGPFKGTKLAAELLGTHISPKIVGSYEQELHAEIEALIASDRYQKVINVGTAEGFYAVGLARRLPKAKILGFDADPKARKRLAEMATLNGVSDQVQIHGILHVQDLDRYITTKSTLLIFDCEGGEAVLLDPLKAQLLAKSDVLVELHPNVIPNINEIIVGRFTQSHEITEIKSRPRVATDFPCLASLPDSTQTQALDERRDKHQSWLVMRAYT